MQPEVFDSGSRPFAANLLAYYEQCKRDDLFLSHAVTPPPGSKDESFAGRAGRHGADGARRHDGAGRRRGHKRPQDAGHQRRLQRSRLDRQHSAARQGLREGVDHLRHPGERAGAEPVVAQAVRALRRQRGRQPDGLPLRRERLHRRLRRGQGALGARLHPRRHRALPPDLLPHPRPHAVEPPGLRPLPLEAAAAARSRAAHDGIVGHRGRARGEGRDRPSCRAVRHDRRHDPGPESTTSWSSATAT